jgi:hypothetical protein
MRIKTLWRDDEKEFWINNKPYRIKIINSDYNIIFRKLNISDNYPENFIIFFCFYLNMID